MNDNLTEAEIAEYLYDINDDRGFENNLDNWKKALKQAQVHNYGADKAYICMPEPVRRIRAYDPEAIQEATWRL